MVLFSPRWKHSRRIEYIGCDQVVYQQDLVVHRTAGRDYEETTGTGLSTLKIWHVFIGPKCRPDYGDLRFSDRYGRELAYYLWPGYDAASARVCVRLEGADAAGVVTVHYGNPSAASASDGDATYGLFCGFDSAEEVAAVFDVVGTPTTTYADSVATITCDAAEYYQSKKTFSRPARLEFRMADAAYGADQYPGQAGFGLYTSSKTPTVCRVTMTTQKYGILACDGGTPVYGSNVLRDLALQDYQLDWISATSATLRKNGISVGAVSSQIPAGPLPVVIGRTYYVCSANQMRFDWILVRTYSAAPPSLLRTSPGLDRVPIGTFIPTRGYVPGDLEVLYDIEIGSTGKPLEILYHLLRAQDLATPYGILRAQDLEAAYQIEVLKDLLTTYHTLIKQEALLPYDIPGGVTFTLVYSVLAEAVLDYRINVGDQVYDPDRFWDLVITRKLNQVHTAVFELWTEDADVSDVVEGTTIRIFYNDEVRFDGEIRSVKRDEDRKSVV